MASSAEPIKRLRLTIEFAPSDIWCDDLDEMAGLFTDDGEPTARDRLHVVTEEWFRERVTVTLCTFPGEKCMNDDFDLIAREGRIVAAEAFDPRAIREKGEQGG